MSCAPPNPRTQHATLKRTRRYSQPTNVVGKADTRVRGLDVPAALDHVSDQTPRRRGVPDGAAHASSVRYRKSIPGASDGSFVGGDFVLYSMPDPCSSQESRAHVTILTLPHGDTRLTQAVIRFSPKPSAEGGQSLLGVSQ